MTTPNIHVRGVDYPIVGPTDFSLGELCDAEQFFGAEFSDEAVNARKLAAILYTSMRRLDSSVTPLTVRELSAAELAEINESLLAWQQEDDAGPPEKNESSENESSDSPPEASSESSDGSAGARSENDPSSTGSPPSAIGSDFDRLTSVN